VSAGHNLNILCLLHKRIYRKEFVSYIMQGQKDFQPRLFYQLSLEELVPSDNYYRKIAAQLPLHFLYKATKGYYGDKGQESIDPIVFFKILLVGYLNNINSDRALMRYCTNCLDVRLFLGYDLNEELPWS
jgi:transposase